MSIFLQFPNDHNFPHFHLYTTDYNATGVPSSLTLSPGDMQACAAVTIIKDAIALEGNKQFFVSIFNPQPLPLNVAPNLLTVTIIDNNS